MFTRHIQPSFAGGEVSPALAARVDSAAYQTWLEQACNFYVHPQGGVSNRPGTAHMATAKNTGKGCRLIPFVVGENESYVLEWGEQYVRVFTSAGQVLDDESQIYELSTPYKADELPALSYTQYDQQLFLAHPDHPLYCLSRVSAGRFSLAPYDIKYGPFGLTNTDLTRQLRIYTTQETLVITGTAATLSLAPLVDSRYFVYGYFRGELFSVAQDYGLNLGQLISDFNTQYASQGLTATNLGGVIQITSPVATGGDWNGAVLSLTYRDSFAHDPAITLSEALSGGVNGGGVVPVGDVSYVLQSNFDLFSPSDVGGRFCLSHALEGQYQAGSLGYADVSAVIKSSGDWRFKTTGTWAGTLALEKSEDLGQTWQAVKYFAHNSGEDNLVEFGSLEDQGNIYWLRLRACNISGQAGYELSAEAFKQHGVVIVTEFLNAREVTISLERPYGSDAWTTEWAEGVFSPKNGYASCVFVYQDRLGLAGTYAQPQSLWFSKTGAYHDFGHARGALLDSDAIAINLSGKKLNTIRHVACAGRLFIFTAGSEWTLSSSGALTPYNLQVQQQSERGASRCCIVQVGNRVLYVQARGGVLRDFYYDDSTASYTGEDLTLCAKHLFAQKSIEEICYQQEPDNLLWCVLSDGGLATLTYMAEQNVCAWTHHQTQGFYRSVCAIPNRGYDEVWFAVERDGVYHIEKLLPRLVSTQPQDQIFLDDSVSKKSNTSFTQVEGLAYLEGKTVAALVDGSPVSGLVVAGGKVDLPCGATCAHVGLGYVSRIKTLPLVSQGTSPDQPKRIFAATLQFADSCGGMVKSDGEKSEAILQRTTEPYDTPLALQTQNYTVTLSATHDLKSCLVVEQAAPLPMTLLAIWSRAA